MLYKQKKDQVKLENLLNLSYRLEEIENQLMNIDLSPFIEAKLLDEEDAKKIQKKKNNLYEFYFKLTDFLLTKELLSTYNYKIYKKINLNKISNIFESGIEKHQIDIAIQQFSLYLNLLHDSHIINKYQYQKIKKEIYEGNILKIQEIFSLVRSLLSYRKKLIEVKKETFKIKEQARHYFLLKESQQIPQEYFNQMVAELKNPYSVTRLTLASREIINKDEFQNELEKIESITNDFELVEKQSIFLEIEVEAFDFYNSTLVKDFISKINELNLLDGKIEFHGLELNVPSRGIYGHVRNDLRISLSYLGQDYNYRVDCTYRVKEKNKFSIFKEVVRSLNRIFFELDDSRRLGIVGDTIFNDDLILHRKFPKVKRCRVVVQNLHELKYVRNVLPFKDEPWSVKNKSIDKLFNAILKTNLFKRLGKDKLEKGRKLAKENRLAHPTEGLWYIEDLILPVSTRGEEGWLYDKIMKKFCQVTAGKLNIKLLNSNEEIRGSKRFQFSINGQNIYEYIFGKAEIYSKFLASLNKKNEIREIGQYYEIYVEGFTSRKQIIIIFLSNKEKTSIKLNCPTLKIFELKE